MSDNLDQLERKEILAPISSDAISLQNPQEMKEIIGVGPRNADSAASTNQKRVFPPE
jgi:hypothetical protein